MKQRNKEELIEYFMELLNENNLLENIMTNEQIREKLNNMIKDVTYNPILEHADATWDSIKGTVNFDPNRINDNNERLHIVHELLHVLSTSIVTLEKKDKKSNILVKCGLDVGNAFCLENDVLFGYTNNKAINEGMTEILAENIVGSEHDGYNTEKDLYKIVSTIIGQETMIEKFFADVNTENQNPSELFKQELINKYGNNLGVSFNEDIKKVFSLSDELLTLHVNYAIHGLNENGKRIQEKTKEEISDTLYSMIERVIDNEPDIMKKIGYVETIKGTNLFRRVRDDIFYEVLSNVLVDDSLDYNEKIELLEKSPIPIPQDIINRVLFKMPESENLTPIQKLEKYVNFVGYNAKKDVLYKLLVESGKISEEKFPKELLFFNGYKGCSSFEELENILDEIKYSKIGNYYEMNGEFYDAEGQRCDLESIPEYYGKEQIPDYLLRGYREKLKILNKDEEVQILFNQIIDRFKQYRDLIKPIRYASNEIEILDNILKLEVEYESFDALGEDKTIRGYFKLNQDGTIEKIEGEKRRLTDDMSDLDIEVQKQTGDVSIADMMKEADDMQKALGQNVKETEDNEKGEPKDGK